VSASHFADGRLAEWLAKPTKWLASRNAGRGRVMPPKSTPTPETSQLARAQATFASQKVNSPHGTLMDRLDPLFSDKSGYTKFLACRCASAQWLLDLLQDVSRHILRRQLANRVLTVSCYIMTQI
jgi:hypothetical protein